MPKFILTILLFIFPRCIFAFERVNIEFYGLEYEFVFYQDNKEQELELEKLELFFNRHRFDNYTKIKFIFDLNEKYSQISKSLEVSNGLDVLLNRFNFNYIIVVGQGDTLYGVKTSINMDNIIIEGENKYYFPQRKLPEDFLYFKVFENEAIEELSFREFPILGTLLSATKHSVYFQDSLYEFKFCFNANNVNYLRDINQWFDMEYFSPFILRQSSKNMDSVIVKLMSVINDLDSIAKLNFLLAFCQQIKFEADEDHYGFQKISYPEVLIFDKRGDCEDKSILFAYLMEKTLNIEPILALYIEKAHANVVYKVKKEYILNNKIIEFKGDSYIICEPSGLWFTTGEQMPGIDFIKDVNLIDIKID